MAEELRWILLGFGLLLIVGIWWRGARKSSQAHDKAELRGGMAEGAPMPAAAPGPDAASSADEAPQRGASPLEPLRIKTADFERVPVLDRPMIAESGMSDGAELAESPMLAIRPAVARDPAPPARALPTAVEAAPAVEAAKPRTDNSGRFAPLAPHRVNASELQKIVTLRICAVGDERWPGQKLIEALELQGLAYGRYQVFHRNHVDGRSLFCVASLIEPGVFDLQQMPAQEFRGITAFAVLPGPVEPLQTFESLIATARRLAESLTGMVQDSQGVPLSPQRAAVLRDEIARFQATLP